MKNDLRLQIAVHTERTVDANHEHALAEIRARTAMEVMKERRELRNHLYDVLGPGDEHDESSALLRLPWQRTTH